MAWYELWSDNNPSNNIWQNTVHGDSFVFSKIHKDEHVVIQGDYQSGTGDRFLFQTSAGFEGTNIVFNNSGALFTAVDNDGNTLTVEFEGMTQAEFASLNDNEYAFYSGYHQEFYFGWADYY